MRAVHPFPARMAHEIATAHLACQPRGLTVLDPMCGSGTVLRAAVEAGLRARGTDVDPLAVLMARVWTSYIDPARLAHDSHLILERAQAKEIVALRDGLPWLDDETEKFIKYWFAEPQRSHLSALAHAIWKCRLPSRDALMLAFSRLIVTKDKGASLARDVSHSRPHKVGDSTDFDVFAGFRRSITQLIQRINPESIRGSACIELGDSRNMKTIQDSSIDRVVTSPPYLNALDYLRGHRLSLVWLGYNISQTRQIRSESIGSERILHDVDIDEEPYIVESQKSILLDKQRGWIRRYIKDAHAVVAESTRVLRPEGSILLVIGNSNLRGVPVDNTGIYVDRLKHFAFRKITVTQREIPASHRYLPPPAGGSGLHARMRTESVIHAVAPAGG